MTSPRGGIDAKSMVLQAVDIVELIGQSVALKRRGKDFVGLCPFHQEKTPSFHVSPGKQFFHCYGCKAGGNAIDFVIKRDRIEFIEALKLLAQQASIELPKFGGSKENAGERQLLLEANSAAGVFFEKLLSSPQEGQAARAYLEKRGFNNETIQRFHLGYASDSWDALLRGPVGRKYTPQQLALAGLVKPRDNGSGYYDTFRNRLMFPIYDENGRVIAFGGRVMPGSQDPAKYLNSPETPLFSKSRCIYGLDQARQKIVETRTVAICEGYTDCVMAHQFGASNVVSVLGTAMTEQHVSILRRFADRIVLLFDPDTAGETAMNRVVELFLTQPVEIAVGSMPEGVDPDEFLLKYGTGAFEKVLVDAVDALTYKWKQLSRQFELSRGDLTAQQKAVQQYLDLLAAARGSGPVDAIRWGSALARVSRLTDIPIDELNRRFRANRTVAKRPTAHETEGGEPKEDTSEARGPVTAQDRAERRVLGLLLVDPHRWQMMQQHVHVEEFTEATRRRLADIYWSHQRDEGEPVFNEFLTVLEEQSLRELAVELEREAEALPNRDETAQEMADYFERMRRTREEQKLTAQVMRTKQENVSPEEVEARFRELVKNTQPTNPHRLGPVRRGGS